jgi:hypothetical protein
VAFQVWTLMCVRSIWAWAGPPAPDPALPADRSAAQGADHHAVVCQLNRR